MKTTVALLIALGCAALAGCGSDGTNTIVERTVVEPGTTETATVTQRAPSPQPNSTVEPSRSIEFFQTPSHNVGCAIGGGNARCDIRERDWSPPPKPANCQLDWGHGLEANAGGAGFVCAGDTAHDASSPVLAYGESTQVGGFSCVSAPEGVTCSHLDSGHGFFISRQRYETF